MPGVEELMLEDAPYVVQILTNLLLNAIGLSPSGTTVSVDVRPFSRGHGVVFGVSDEGPACPGIGAPPSSPPASAPAAAAQGLASATPPASPASPAASSHWPRPSAAPASSCAGPPRRAAP